MAKRKPPIAKNLVNNSVAGIMSAIEIHNKPIMKYRYEMVVLLVLNAWELLLKGYIYKYHKKVKLFLRDDKTRSFESCLNIVNLKIGKDFNPIQENLKVLYEYRNQIAHFYIKELDPIIYSLLRKNIIFYSRFIQKYFKIDLTKNSDLVLLPIGFKKPISPPDYISSKSMSQDASQEVKTFLQTVLAATQRLNEANIEETIFIDFKMNLTNVNRIKNADVVAGIDNSQSNELILNLNKKTKIIKVGKEGEKVVLTRNKAESQGTLIYEELQDGIFDEINNIIDANKLLAKDKEQFMLGAQLYYRIYSERHHANYSISNFKILAKAAMFDFYSPFLFWLIKLPAYNIAKIIFEVFDNSKSPKINNLIKIIILLGGEAFTIFENLLKKKYEQVVQKPDFYYTFFKLSRSTKANPILKSLNANYNKKLQTHGSNHKFTYGDFIKDINLAINTLSRECFNVYNGQYEQRSITRDLDFLAYGSYLLNNEQIINAIKAINAERIS